MFTVETLTWIQKLTSKLIKSEIVKEHYHIRYRYRSGRALRRGNSGGVVVRTGPAPPQPRSAPQVNGNSTPPYEPVKVSSLRS
ncbi:unnamed protein product [Nezara viridula]|uniref:Uncharacterized protein n=1 Tax=Nezara viridula TaxID=85310 RepID=A0A9P0E668_NEZVI|nr:unnamed protein product [Nezara viridula]